MKINKILTSLTLAVALMFAPACHRQVVITNAPVGVNVQAVTTWYAAAGVYKDLGDLTKQLATATVGLKGEFPDNASYDKTLQGFGQASQIGIQAGNYLESVPQTWDANVASKIGTYSDQIQMQINMAINDGLAHVKDSPKKQAILTLTASVNTAIKVALALNKPVGGN